jgi:hypothetical protein
VIAALLTILFGLLPNPDDWVPAMEGLAIAVFMFYLAYTLGLRRFYVLALLSAVVGVGLSFASYSEEISTALYFLSMGLCLVASGALALWNYLDHTEGSKEV